MNDNADKKTIEGKYANSFRVGHNAFEFLIEFGQEYQNSQEEVCHTRIITSPSYIKQMHDTLVKAIEEYERSYGTIEGC